MGRDLRPWWFALAVSLALHGAFVFGPHGPPTMRVLPAPSVYEVELAPPRPPSAALHASPLPAPVAAPARSPDADSASEPVAAAPVPPAELAQLAESGEPAGGVGAAAESMVVPTPGNEPLNTAEGAEPAPLDEPAAAGELPEMPPLNALPARIDMRFRLTYGIASGEQTLVWVNEGGSRYTAISVAEATGIAGLFYRGRFVQTSRGRITAMGLQPEEFWDQRGERRSSAQFDRETGQVTLQPAKGPPRHFAYTGDVQDALSLFFQIALTAPPASDRLEFTVFNGKKLRTYRYEVRGATWLDTAVGRLRVLHLARLADGDGRFEVWLAVDRHYLPVRIVKTDDNENEIELALMSLTP